MNRRTFLGGTLALSLAGCLGGTPPTAADGTDDADGTDETDGSGGTHPRFTELSLTDTGQCDDPGTAHVDFGDDAVTVTGCARGRNGCAVPVLGDVSYRPDDDRVTVVVASEVKRRGDVGCTEALVALGYEVRVAMDGIVPGVVRVVHDDVDGRREVALVRRDGA